MISKQQKASQSHTTTDVCSQDEFYLLLSKGIGVTNVYWGTDPADKTSTTSASANYPSTTHEQRLGASEKG